MKLFVILYLLDWASINGMKETVFFLVERGIDIEIKNNFDKTAAEEAYDKGFMEISEFLVEKEVALLKNIEIYDNLKNDEIKEMELIDNDDEKINEKDLNEINKDLDDENF